MYVVTPVTASEIFTVFRSNIYRAEDGTMFHVAVDEPQTPMFDGSFSMSKIPSDWREINAANTCGCRRLVDNGHGNQETCDQMAIGFFQSTAQSDWNGEGQWFPLCSEHVPKL